MRPALTLAGFQKPHLQAADFTPTKFNTAEDKTKVGNHLLAFIAEDCGPTASGSPGDRN